MNNSIIEKKIISNIVKNFDNYNESYGYGVFLFKNKDGSIELKDKEGLMKKILSNEDNFDYIIQNIPGFLMGGGFFEDVPSILTGRPSKAFNIQDINEKNLEELCKNYKKKLNYLSLSIKGHALAVEDSLKIKGETFLMIRNPWGSGESTDIDYIDSDIKLKDTEYSNFNSNSTKTGFALLNFTDFKKSFLRGSALDFEAGKFMFSYKMSGE